MLLTLDKLFKNPLGFAGKCIINAFSELMEVFKDSWLSQDSKHMMILQTMVHCYGLN